MNRLSFIFFLIAIIAIGGGAAWYLVDTRNDAFGPASVTPSTPEVREGLAIYTNGSYGFSIFYPESAAVLYPFSEDTRLENSWRENALPDAVGVPIVAIIPTSFSTMVRIGASNDPKEIERCEEADQTSGEEALPDRQIGARVWKAFRNTDTMSYPSGVSYRTLYEDRCIALEQVRLSDVSEATLLAEYEKLSEIIDSFSFAR